MASKCGQGHSPLVHPRNRPLYLQDVQQHWTSEDLHKGKDFLFPQVKVEKLGLCIPTSTSKVPSQISSWGWREVKIFSYWDSFPRKKAWRLGKKHSQKWYLEGDSRLFSLKSFKAVAVDLRHIHRDSTGSPVVKTLPSNAKGTGSIPGQGAKIPPALRPKPKHKAEAIL